MPERYPPEYMGAAHLAASDGGGDFGTFQPQHQNHFLIEIDLTDIGGSADGRILTLSVASAFLPSLTMEEIDLPFMNEHNYVSGKAEYEAGTLTLRDFVDTATAQTICNWQVRAYDPRTGKVGYAAHYKREASILLLPPTGGSIDREWRLRGVWPQAVNYGSLDYAGSDVVQIEVTLRYDNAVPKRLAPVPGTTPNPPLSTA